jgi:uncharacterized membrane protein YphA (DoxX/SURF4 family)
LSKIGQPNEYKIISGIAVWVLRIIAALIMLQTLFFKFTGSEESVYIFSKLGMEPWGRIATGIMELVASILILIPRTTFFGAVLAIGLMLGAIGAHVVKLGIEVKNDGGQLFIYALVVLISSAILAFMYRQEGVRLLRRVFS